MLLPSATRGSSAGPCSPTCAAARDGARSSKRAPSSTAEARQRSGRGRAPQRAPGSREACISASERRGGGGRRRVRRRHRAAGRACRGAECDRLGGRSHGRGRTCRVGQDPRAAIDGRARVAARRARRRVGADAAHHLGRAGLPRDRRIVVSTGLDAAPIPLPTGVRSAARPRRRCRPPLRALADEHAPPDARAVVARGHGPLGAEAPADRGGRARRRHGGRSSRRAPQASPTRSHPIAPSFVVEEVDVAGPPTSVARARRGLGRGRGRSSPRFAAGAEVEITAPNGARAQATSTERPHPRLRVSCGDPLDEIVLAQLLHRRGAHGAGMGHERRHQRRRHGEPQDLTIRSFGILRATEMPPVEVEIEPSDGPAVNGSDAVFAAVAAAAWIAQGCPQDWPTRRTPL